MELFFNPKKHKMTARFIREGHPTHERIRLIAKGFLVSGFLISGAYYLFNFFGFGVYLADKKESVLLDGKVILNTLLILGGFLVLSLVFYYFLYMFVSSYNIYEREDEKVKISQERIEYLYRNTSEVRKPHYYSIEIPLLNSTIFEYDRKHNKLFFFGNFTLSRLNPVTDDFAVLISKSKVSRFFIYDCFSPGIYETLLKLKVNVKVL